MKAAVIYDPGTLPQYTDYPDPVPQEAQEVLLSVTAAAVKHIDRSRASGRHYSSGPATGAGTVPGGDGVGLLEDGTRVYAAGVSGMLAERAVIDSGRMVPVPAGLDDLVAAALPNAAIGSAMALRFRAGIQAGDTVLINGATGFTGRIAVQVARHYGAGRIIVTGRNEAASESLRALGADEFIPLNQDDAALQAAFTAVHERNPLAVIIDYLWGHSAELLLKALKGKGTFTARTRFVAVGSVTGDQVPVSAAMLRSADLQLSGSGLGSWTKPQLQLFFSEILPELFTLAVHGQLIVPVRSVPLRDIATLWDMEIPAGERLVVTM